MVTLTKQFFENTAQIPQGLSASRYVFGFISAEEKIHRNQDQKEHWIVLLDWPPTCYTCICNVPKKTLSMFIPQ